MAAAALLALGVAVTTVFAGNGSVADVIDKIKIGGVYGRIICQPHTTFFLRPSIYCSLTPAMTVVTVSPATLTKILL